jgi:two-component system sensor histidine kinase BarA
LLNDFIAMLPDTLQAFESQIQRGAFDELCAEVHKLHGACCYTGLPRLQNLAKELEIALKLNHTDLLDELLQALVNEARKVIEENNANALL